MKFQLIFAILFSLLISQSCSKLSPQTYHSRVDTERSPADDTFSSQNAFEVYNELRKMQFTKEAKRVAVHGADPLVNNGVVSYGGEKEGSSARITKVFGPSAEHFKNVVEEMDESQKRDFLVHFIDHLSEKKLKRVVKEDGSSIEMSYRFLRGIDIQEKSTEELFELFNEWLSRTEDRPFSFLQLSMRKRLYNADFPGITQVVQDRLRSYRQWKPLFGKPEKFLDQLVSQSVIEGGWEILTKPQYSYGEHEHMIEWFKETMGTKGQPFEAPGHQRILWPKPDLPESEMSEFLHKLSGTYKLAQALIVLHGISGKTGINMGHWKFMMADSDFVGLNLRRNDVFRLEQGRFVDGSMSLEMRAGTKDKSIQRYIQQMITSRVSTGDFGDIGGATDWELLPRNKTAGGYPGFYNADRFIPPATEVASKFSVDEQVVEDAFNKLKGVKRMSIAGGGTEGAEVNIRYEFWVPFWHWENAPFLSETKKTLLKRLTKSFLESIAALDNPSEEQVQRLFQDWVRVSEIDVDIKKQLTPKKYKDITTVKAHDYVPSNSGRTDVNKIKLGIEYSASFPLDNKLLYSDEKEDGKNHWRLTTFDLTEKERESVLREYSYNLAKELGVDSPNVYKVSEDGHGHGLDVAFALRDRRNREWRVEWDGIGRTYSPGKKNAMNTSKRGGHIEIVTPKFTPKMNEIDAVYRAMDKSNINPAFRKGGSHINIDLAAFDGKPKELARFLAIFHQHRSIMALMYQHPNRRNAAEAIDISNDFARQLASFDGTELELKKLLYENRYFNTRLGRKTRYVQFDLSAYFQDVIPDEFISDDFDISNPWEPWRRQFRVNPKIRKMEGRLFGAPDDSLDAALQVKLVRAMLHKALNSDEPLSGYVQNIKHEDYVQNPKKAYEDLRKMTSELGLDFKEYEMWASRGLEHSEAFVESDFYRSVEEKNRIHPKMDNWKNARETQRSTRKTNQLRKRVLEIDESEIEPEVRRFMQKRQSAVKEAYNEIHQMTPEKLSRSGHIIRRSVKRLPSCSSAVKRFFD